MHLPTKAGFLSINDLVNNQGELTVTLDYNSSNSQVYIEACVQLPANATRKDLAAAYLSLCNNDAPVFSSLCSSMHTDTPLSRPAVSLTAVHIYTPNTCMPLTIFAGKKYKLVACKICPIETELPSRFHIIHDIKGNPLQNLPCL